jgi:hypothetical protein
VQWKEKWFWIERIQGVPVFVSVITAAITGDPGGCAFVVQLSCHAQGHNKRDIL